MTANGLQRVAEEMKEKARTAKHGHDFRRLSGGLTIVYGHRAEQWRLAIGRQAPQRPCDQELQIVAAAFGAPCDFEPVQRQAQWWDPIDEHALTYHVLELRWREVGA